MEATNRKLAVLVCAAAICIGSVASAQANPEMGDTGEGQWAPPAGGGEASASASASTETGVEASADTSGDSEPSSSAPGTGAHADVVGKFGVGFFGLTEVPICLDAGACATGNVAAATLGVRYWLSDFLGIEAALGFGSESGTISRTGMTDELETSLMGFALHGGVPLALAASGNFVFQVVPELDIAFGSGTDFGPTSAEDIDLSGLLFRLGGRAGAEIHFGFIGLPQLSLQGTVGLHLRLESRTLESGATEISSSRTIIRTTVQDEPWDIFSGNITAIYYFVD